MTYDEAVELIQQELASAERKFQRWQMDPIHAAAVVAEEAGELVRATLHWTYEDTEPVFETWQQFAAHEAAQTAAMAIRFLMHLESYRTQPCLKGNLMVGDWRNKL